MAGAFINAIREPADDLFESRALSLAGGRAQGCIGGEQDPGLLRNIGPLAELAQWDDVGFGLPPIAAQSRRASSSSLSEADSHSARRRPRSQWSRMMAATWRPLPQPVPSPSIQPRRKRTGADRASPSPVASVAGSRPALPSFALICFIGGLRDVIAVIAVVIFVVGDTRDGLQALADAVERR